MGDSPLQQPEPPDGLGKCDLSQLIFYGTAVGDKSQRESESYSSERGTGYSAAAAAVSIWRTRNSLLPYGQGRPPALSK